MAQWQVNEVQKYLKGAEYPMSGQELAKLAESNGAEQELVDALAGVGSADGPNKVMAELKGSLGGPTPDGPKERRPRDIDGFQVDDVQASLKGASYPSSGDELAKVAQGNGAGDDLVEALRGIGKVDAPTDVMHELKSSLGGAQS